MNYIDLVDHIVDDHALAYGLDEQMPIALYELAQGGWRLRAEHEDEAFIVDETGLIIDTCENEQPINGHLAWAATESYSLVLGA